MDNEITVTFGLSSSRYDSEITSVTPGLIQLPYPSIAKKQGVNSKTFKGMITKQQTMPMDLRTTKTIETHVEDKYKNVTIKRTVGRRPNAPATTNNS